MQPMLVLTALYSGILYLNGSFAGEIGADVPLMRPVGGRGPVYLDYRPLTNACRSMARRLVFSGGEPMGESAAANENMNIIIWPGGTVEIEFSPIACGVPSQSFQAAGHSFSLDSGSGKLLCDGSLLGILPKGASLPEYRILDGGAALLGSFTGGRYLLTCDSACSRQTGFLQAQQIEIENGGRISAVVSTNDLVGHATLETWRLTDEGLMLLASEPAWAGGAPRWPQTPEETARAAMEAAFAGLDAEAERYLAPALRQSTSLSELKALGDLCVQMKYAPPDARPSVGMLTLEGECLARVVPLYFRASPSGGAQGPWQIDAFSLE